MITSSDQDLCPYQPFIRTKEIKNPECATDG